ncbi:MAG: hypothetical protein ACPGVO_19325 [Spirulinaceae cyanobacterium]
MNESAIALVAWLLKVVHAYVIAGLIFTVPFVIFGIHRVDPNVKGWSILFRILIVPGMLIFWPLFAVRLVRGKTTPTERTAHRRAAQTAAAQTTPVAEGGTS